MGTIGERIRAERERLGFTQEVFAAIADAAKRSQVGWEQDRTRPDADVLAAWAARGADVLYIITGKRMSPIDMQLLGMSEAAIKVAYEHLRGEPAPQGRAVTINALTKVYNSVAARSGPDGDRARMVREDAAEYLAYLDDPDDRSMLERAIFRKPPEVERQSTTTVITNVKGGRVAGRDIIQGSRKRKK